MLEGSRIRAIQGPPYHIIIDDCFGEAQSKEIFLHILSLKAHFVEAPVGSGEAIRKEYRTNSVCYIDQLFAPRPESKGLARNWEALKHFRAQRSPLLRSIDELIESDAMRFLLDSAPFPLCKFRSMNVWDTSVSRYGSGEFYMWHSDRQEVKGDKKVITMVYYVRGASKKFDGGEILLSSGLHYRGRLLAEGETSEITPEHDRLVIFNSRTAHRVKPTVCGPDFEDGRFSVNVWLGRAGPLAVDDQF